MKKKSWKYMIVFGILIIALAIYGTWQHKTNINLQKIPDSQFQQMTYTTYDQNGNIKRVINATNMQHYNKDNTSDFTLPRIIIHTTEGQTWHVQASKGNSEQGTSIIHLYNDVIFHRLPSQNNNDLLIKTSQATLIPDKKIGSSTQPTTIIQPDSTVNCVGINADLKQGIIHLLAEVNAIYAPQKTSP